MSAATDLPPVVFIPPQARPQRPTAGSGRRAPVARALQAVPPPLVPTPLVPTPLVPTAAPPMAVVPAAAPPTAMASTAEVAQRPRLARRRPTAVRAGDRSCLAVGSSVRASSAVSLTPRGRLLLWLTTGAVAVGLLLGAWLSQGAAQRSAGTPTRSLAAVPTQVVVQPGDTLWSIASNVAPDRDPRAVVDALERANHLESPVVAAGQVLQVALA